MKILHANEVKANKDTQIQRDLIRTKSVKDVLNKEQSKLDMTSATIDVMLAKQQERYAEEEIKHLKRIADLTSETKTLEDKRDELLIPIHLEEEKARIKLEEASKALSQAELLRVSNEENAELLQDKLDNLSEREQKCDTLEQKLLGKQQNIKVQETTITTLSTELSTKWDEYFKVKLEHDSKVQYESSSIFLAQTSLNAQKDLLDERQKNLINYEIQLKDREATLERELKRINEQRKT